MSNLKVLFLLYHRVQNAEMRAFSDPYFPAYGQNRRPENTDYRKSVFRHILRNEYLNVKHTFFTSCLIIEMIKSVK